MSVQRATVLVGIDGSPDSDRALGWAADEAARFGMSLRIVHVAETATLDVAGRGAGEVSEALAEAGDRILQDGRGLALHRRPGLAVETTLVHDRNVPAGLRRYAGEAAEVVIGHRGRGGFTGLLLGSTALRVAGRFPGPVVVVRGPVDGTADEVVVGLDLVEDPAPALDHAFAAAAAREARLRALHAWRPAPLAAEAGVDVRTTGDTRRSHLSTVLAPWRARHPGVKVAEDVVIGHPVEALATASAHADLVVVGSRGRRFPLGSVGHGVIHYARRPVAVVRPYD